MAKTTELKTKVEPFIRKELEKLYPGHTFTEKSLPLHKKRDGTYAFHKFDAVSEDNTIVASIKSHSWLTSGGKSPSGKIGQIYKSLYFLSLINARAKLLILTDRKAYEGFLTESDGKLAEGIEIRLCPLSQQPLIFTATLPPDFKRLPPPALTRLLPQGIIGVEKRLLKSIISNS